MGAGVPNRIRASVATCLQNLLELEWLGGHLRDLCGCEHEVGQPSCGAAVAIGERMTPDGLRMDGDAELARRPFFGGLPRCRIVSI